MYLFCLNFQSLFVLIISKVQATALCLTVYVLCAALVLGSLCG